MTSSPTSSPTCATAGATAVRPCRRMRCRSCVKPPGVLKVRRTEVWLGGLLVLLMLGSAVAADGNPFLPVPGAEFRSGLPNGKEDRVQVPGFLLQEHPVTN